MIDSFGREIKSLRVSITDKCNLHCGYCKPPSWIGSGPHLLSYEQIEDVVRAAVGMGVRKVRITGGEPLLRRNVEILVRMLACIDGIEDLAMSTNGILLEKHAETLADAGLHRVNVSLDSIDPDRFRSITGGGDLNRVLAGIAAARKAGLEPIKLNCVYTDSSDEPDALGVARLAEENGLEARFIQQMDFPSGKFAVVEGGSGGDCRRCDRLRLSCDGQIRPCLFSDMSFSVSELGGMRALEEAIRAKPEMGASCSQSWIRVTGG